MALIALSKNKKVRAAAAVAFAGLVAGLFWPFTASAQHKITIKIAFATIHSGMGHWAQMFKADMERRAGNRVNIQLYSGGQLGNEPSVIRGVQLGAIEIAEMPPAILVGVDPRYSIFQAPELFDSLAHAQRALHDPQFVKTFWPVLESKGIKVLGFDCESVSDYNSYAPIKTLADFKGKKFRVLGSKLEVEIMRRLGATGVPMNFSDVIPAFQQKAIDGVRAGIVIFVPFKFYTIAHYIVRTGESTICPVHIASKVWFDRLPSDLKSMIQQEALKDDATGLDWNIALEHKLYAAWRKEGGTIYNLSSADRKELRRRLETVGDAVFKNSPQVLAAYKALKAVAIRTRK